MEAALERIARALNNTGVQWALGGSWLLSCHGLGALPRDIDLIVAESDALTAESLLSPLGQLQRWEPTPPYETRRFLEYVIDGQDVDVMIGLSIRHSHGLYRCPFDRFSIAGHMTVGGERVPLMALEEWFVLYQLIPGRDAKAALIEERLAAGTLNRFLLTRALDQELPPSIRQRIAALIP